MSGKNSPTSDASFGSKVANEIRYDEETAILILAPAEARLATWARQVENLGYAPLPPKWDDTATLFHGSRPVKAVLLDMVDSGTKTDYLLKQAQNWTNSVPVIAILDSESLDLAINLLQFDAIHFLCEPIVSEDLVSMMDRINDDERLRAGRRTSRPLRESDGADPDLLSELSEEVSRIARALASLAGSAQRVPAAPSLPETDAGLPVTARFVRELIRQRRAREQFFPAELFADPAWDILLDLSAARIENKRVSVSSLCIAAAVPATTALRWIKGMTDAGLLVRRSDPADGRRIFIDLSDEAAEAMQAYLGSIVRGG